MTRFKLTLEECKQILGYQIDKIDIGEKRLKLFCDKRKLTPDTITSRITCQYNTNEPVHRWTSYIHGFSASFVRNVLNRHKGNKWAKIMDPFKGRIDDITFYTFYLGNIIAYIKVDKRKARTPMREMQIDPNKPLYLVKRNFWNSKEISIMQNIVQKLNG